MTNNTNESILYNEHLKDLLRIKKASYIDFQIQNAKILLQEINSTPLSTTYYETVNLMPENVQPFLLNQTSTEEKEKFIKEMIEAMEFYKSEVLNEDPAINQLIVKMFNSVDKTNQEGIMFLKTIKNMLNEGEILITTSLDKEKAAYSRNFDYISVGKKYIDSNNYMILIHELTHLLHEHILHNYQPENFEKIIANARNIATDNGKVKECSKVYIKRGRRIFKQAKKELNLKLYNVAYEFILLRREYRKKGLDVFEAIRVANSEVYINKINEKYCALIENNYESEYSSELADIIDAAFEGKRQDNNGNPIGIIAGHDIDTFSKPDDQFSEMLAEFTVLKVMGNNHDLNLLKEMFGHDFYKMLDNSFNKIIDQNIRNIEEKNKTI